MRKLALLALIVVVSGAGYLLKDAGHVPLFSASLERLAETATEGWCSGEAFWLARNSPGDAKTGAAECRSNRPGTDPDLQAVQPAFCQAITSLGYKPGVDGCMKVVTLNRYWPTYDGGITESWSRKFPYPGDLILQDTPVEDTGRTGEREGNFR